MPTTVAGTGPRALAANSTLMVSVVETLQRALEAEAVRGDVTVISGMAEGFDEALAVAAIRVGVPFVAAVPSPDYGRHYWRERSVTGRNRLPRFEKILEKASQVHYVFPEPPHPGKPNANLARNEWMVDRCSVLWVW